MKLCFPVWNTGQIIIVCSLLPMKSTPQAMYGAGTNTLNPSTPDADSSLVHGKKYDTTTMHSAESVSAHLVDTNKCKPNTSFIWCLPQDYNQEKHPFTYFHLVNQSLPWDYNFRFVIEEINTINDKAQLISISMYFAVSWLEPRLQINESAIEWSEARTGPANEVNESPEILKYIWYPELEIYGLDTFGRQRVLKEMSGVRIIKNKTITYELGVRIAISCQMNFDDYPLDAHTCQFQVGSYYDTKETVTCKSYFIYELERQRNLQHFIQIEKLPTVFKKVTLPSGIYAACGFQVRLQRKKTQFITQVYLPSFMFVIVSWVSFLIKPEVVPGRMALLVTLFLVLINIFNSVREEAPISSRLNAIDLYLVVCVFLVFGALIEYAVILLLLKGRRIPLISLDKKQAHNPAFNLEDPAQSPTRPGRAEEQTHSGDDGRSSQATEIEIQDRIRRTSRMMNSNGYSPIDQCNQSPDVGLSLHKQALVDNIDAWAMWLSPPIFIAWNIVYWVAYRQTDSSHADN